MLRGKFEVISDGKRITLPDIFRSQIRDTWGEHGVFLLLCPIDNVAYEAIPYSTMPKRIKSSCMIRQIDARGRIVLPKPLINLLQEEGSWTVKLVGLLDRFAIWIPWRLDEAERKYEEEFPEEIALFDAVIAELNNEAK